MTPGDKVTQSFVKVVDIIDIIDEMAMEMRNDRNDGWVKGHYRNRLCNIRDYINDKLESE
jgi:hypothetical protein